MSKKPGSVMMTPPSYVATFTSGKGKDGGPTKVVSVPSCPRGISVRRLVDPKEATAVGC